MKSELGAILERLQIFSIVLQGKRNVNIIDSVENRLGDTERSSSQKDGNIRKHRTLKNSPSLINSSVT